MINPNEMEGGSEEAPPVIMSIFFASNIANKHDDQVKNKQKDDYWHAIRLQYDISEYENKNRSEFANHAAQ